VVLTEPCPAKWSEVVHKYSPRHHHNGQFISHEDSVTSSQLDSDDDDGAGSSDIIATRMVPVAVTSSELDSDDEDGAGSSDIVTAGL